jgi:hypothetical protein
MAKVFECERDGVVIRGEDDEELLANVERDVGDAHADLVGTVSRDDVLAIAKEA